MTAADARDAQAIEDIFFNAEEGHRLPTDDVQWLAERARRVPTLEAEVERLGRLAARKVEVAPFMCESHLCGQCGGCLARGVRDYVTESAQAVKAAEAERDALQQQVANVQALADEFEQAYALSQSVMPSDPSRMWPGRVIRTDVAAQRLRAALGGPAAPTPEPTITGHDGFGAPIMYHAQEPQPTEYEVAAKFQDGEVFTVAAMAAGMGLYDDEAPVLVARRVGDDEWLTLGSGGEFIAEYEVWDDGDDDEEPVERITDDRGDEQVHGADTDAEAANQPQRADGGRSVPGPLVITSMSSPPQVVAVPIGHCPRCGWSR